jgi:hypothetical protein
MIQSNYAIFSSLILSISVAYPLLTSPPYVAVKLLFCYAFLQSLCPPAITLPSLLCYPYFRCAFYLVVASPLYTVAHLSLIGIYAYRYLHMRHATLSMHT